MVGVSRPASGTVRGRPGRIGYVPERFAAHQRMTARAYLAHLGRIRGLSTVVARARADALLELLSFVDGGSLRHLSKGNAQKVALVQALLVPPHLLVLDEPWSGLDAAAHEVLADLIDEVAGRGGAVVFTDHREAVVDGVATDRYHISEGRVRR
ncbi:ATP-binding cassette domain-containing protein [Actinomycetes bacterium KLBMP 9797]